MNYENNIFMHVVELKCLILSVIVKSINCDLLVAHTDLDDLMTIILM